MLAFLLSLPFFILLLQIHYKFLQTLVVLWRQQVENLLPPHSLNYIVHKEFVFFFDFVNYIFCFFFAKSSSSLQLKSSQHLFAILQLLQKFHLLQTFPLYLHPFLIKDLTFLLHVPLLECFLIHYFLFLLLLLIKLLYTLCAVL